MDADEATRLSRIRALELACDHYDGTDDEVLETAAKFAKFITSGETPAKPETATGDVARAA